MAESKGCLRQGHDCFYNLQSGALFRTATMTSQGRLPLPGLAS